MKCGSEKLRSLVKEYFGDEELDHYDKVVDQCKLGQALKDDRVWAPICPAYPNLKGVTCEEIDEFISDKLPEFFNTSDYIKLRNRTRDPLRQLEFDESPEERKERFFFSLKKNMSEKEFDVFHKQIESLSTVDRILDHIERQTQRITSETITFTEDYLHHIKVYDRDEAYQAFKKLGEQIKNDYPDKKYPNILNDKSTIFVTTPRGGHEMLSMFVYANNISKEQIPSDITWDHLEHDGYTAMQEHEYRENPHKKAVDDDAEYYTEIHGRTWLGDESRPVKNIFIVDDIIASGEQINITARILREMFPDAKINSITLCKREFYGDPPLEPITNKYYTDTKTTGIEKFRRLRYDNKLDDQYITCLFPHACPDGSSDELMVELMGGKRCPPEKRLSRKDL